MTGADDPRAVIAAAGEGDGLVLPVAEVALALAALDRPGVAAEHYRDHLAELADAAGEAAARLAQAPGAAPAAAAVAEVLTGRFGYAGDDLTYDDPQNANLMRVIDRRRGLPVSLSILYMHAARAAGWGMQGLAFPGHFLVQMERAGERVIVDPFSGGRSLGAAELRALLKNIAGDKAELTPDIYAPVGDRDVLLRLQNNIKLRALRAGDMDRAVEIATRMLLLAPHTPGLYRELGLMEAHRGNLRDSLDALERYAALASGEAQRRDAAHLLQEVGAKLN